VRRYFFIDHPLIVEYAGRSDTMILKIVSIMRYRLILLSFMFSIFIGFAHAQNTDSVATPVSHSVSSDSIIKDSLQSFPAPAADSISSGTSKSAPSAQNQPQKLTLIKRKYNSRQQVLLATGMMIFVIGIMTMAQQWNPR